MIRTFGLGPWVKKRRFWAFGLGLRAKIVGKSQGKCKNKALGKKANFGLFSVLGWPYRAKKGVRVLTIFPMFPVIFCFFSPRCDHDLSLFYCPYLFIFFIFYYKKSTTQHTTYTIHNHTHAHTHAHLPLTVILRVVCVRVTRGKTRENA